MTHDQEYKQLIESIAQKGLKLIEGFKNQPIQLTAALNQYLDLTQDFQFFIVSLLKNPEKVWQMQLAYWQEAANLTQEQFNSWLTGKPLPIHDKRFSSEEWVNNPFFNFLSQHYLLATEHINTLLEHMEYGDKQLAKRIQFLTRQYLDALSPANYLQTNPQLLAETVQSNGKNLLRGLQNLLTDLETGSSRLMIKMTDMDAFKIGENIAVTPGKVIFRNDMMELIQYTPATQKVYAIPLLIVPPWINKYYILDLSPKNSFVKWLVGHGVTVFMISWVNPDAQYASKGFFDYLKEGPLTAIEVIKKQLDVKQINALGFCLGGTLLASTLAYLTAHKKQPVNSATFLASMIDFSDPGDIAVYIDEEQVSRLEEEMNMKGFLDGQYMASTFNSLRANDLIWSFFIKNYLQGHNPVPFDILYWNADATNMPAAMHSQYLRWMYLNNDLIKPNKIVLNKTPLDISKIDTPSFFVSTQKDHIAPWKTTYIGFQHFRGEKRFLLGGSGHIAGIINPPEIHKYCFYRNLSTHQSPDEWLQDATEVAGSWWPEWFKWLKGHSGKQISAPVLEQLPYKALGDAPGTYVLRTYRPSAGNVPASYPVEATLQK